MKISEKILIVIPVRLASTRLPRKPLANIVGKTMIQRVYEQAKKANIGDILIACDGEEIANEVKKFNANFVITDPNLPSGTDRVYEAFKSLKKDYDIIVNLQGDLPAIDPKVIISCINSLSNSAFEISTVASIIQDSKEITNPNVVKIAITQNGRALYFSRSAIPHSKKDFDEYFHHIGIYAYRKSALERFVSLEPSSLEKRESLEQLRAIENDMKIGVSIVDSHPLSVDTAEDLAIITNLISNS